MNSTHTYSLIAHAMYKYRLISKRSRPLYTALLAQATTDTEGLFEAPARKFKRDAVAAAIREWNHLAILTFEGVVHPELRRLVNLLAEKNAHRSGYDSFAEHCETLAENGSLFSVNLSDSQFDPESDYSHSVMVRPIEVIQAEQAERAEAIRLERMAAVQRAEDDDFDDEDDDWEDVDDDDPLDAM